MKKQLIGAFIGLFCLLLGHNALAALPNSSSYTPDSVGVSSQPLNPTWLRIGNGWSGSTDGLRLYFSSITGNTTFAIDSYFDSNYSNHAANVVPQIGGAAYLGFHDFIFPSVVTLDPSLYYVIILFNNNIYEAGDVGGVNGSFGYAKVGLAAPVNFTPYMLWSGAIVLDLEYPTSTISSLNFWRVKRYIPSDIISSTYHIAADYSDNSSTTFQYADFLYSSILDETIDSNIPLQDGHGIFTPTNVSKTFYARLRLTDANDNTIATTTPISFKLVSNLSYFDLPSSTTSTAASAINCDANSNVFSYSLCAMLGYLFVPDGIVFNNFGQLWGNVKDKPPIGYFGAISSALGNVGTSTAAYQLATVGAFAAYFSPIKLAFAWLLWFVFAFWVFNRFRHIQL